MAWVRLDDGFITHPKALAAGPLGRELFISGLCWCATHLTDGQIPKVVVPVLAAQAGVKPALTKRLVSVGLWHDEGDHYRVHDFLDYNEPADTIRARRDARAEAGRKGGLRSGETRRGSKAEALASSLLQANGKYVGSHSLEPRPDPTRPDPMVRVCTTDNDEMLCGASSSSSVVETAALVFGYAQAASSVQAIDNPAKYASGVARNVLAEQGERLRAYVAEHPSADAEAVAANVFKLDRWALIGARKAMS